MPADDHLYILWTSSEVDTFDEMVFMYALNAKKLGWWMEVTLIIWGASARLVGNDELIQLKIKELLSSGIRVEACKACANNLGVEDTLNDLGVDVKYWGRQLTTLLKGEKKLITI